jgi:peroxiredoxin
MKPPLVTFLFGFVAITVGGWVSFSTVEGPHPTKRPNVERGVVQVGDEAPNFTLYDLSGNVRSLSQFRGKVVLLNFWATWCGPCRVEMPAMEQLYRTLPRKEFEILAVSTDPQGSVVTRPFQQEMGFTFPILHDSEYRVGLAYGARTIPITFMVDRRGIVRQKIFGARDWDSPEARDLIHELMRSSS